MSGETIRDVLIKVSIQNGSLKLGPLDTSAFDASIKAAKESLDKVFGSIKIDPMSTTGTSAGGKPTLYSQDWLNEVSAMKSRIEELKQSAGGSGGISAIFQGISGSVVALTAGFAALSFEMKSVFDRYTDLRNESRRYWADQEADVGRAAKYTMNIGGIRAQAALDRARHAPDAVGLNYIMPNIAMQESMEAGLRAYEATDAPSMFKHTARGLAEYALPRHQTLNQVGAEIADRDRRLGILRESLSEIEMTRKNRAGQYRNAMNANRTSEQHILDEMPLEGAVRTGRGWISRAGMDGAIDLDSGLYHTQRAALADVRARRGQIEESFKKDEAESVEREGKAKADIVRLDKEKLQLQQQQLAAARELQQSVYTALQNEKERVKGLEIGFGSASMPQQFIAMRLQKKHERIEAQRAANVAAGRPIDQGVERYNPWERQQNHMGGIASISMERQAKEDAAKMGFKTRDIEKDLEQELNALNALPKPKMKADIDQGVQDTQKSISDHLDALERLNTTYREGWESATRKVEELISQANNFKLKSQGR